MVHLHKMLNSLLIGQAESLKCPFYEVLLPLVYVLPLSPPSSGSFRTSQFWFKFNSPHKFRMGLSQICKVLLPPSVDFKFGTLPTEKFYYGKIIFKTKVFRSYPKFSTLTSSFLLRSQVFWTTQLFICPNISIYPYTWLLANNKLGFGELGLPSPPCVVFT